MAGHSDLGSDGRYFSSGLPLMVSWVQYLAKGPKPDFNDGPRITRIVAAFLSPAFFESDSNNGPSPGHSNLGQMEDTPVQVSHLWSPGGSNICPRASGLTLIMAQGITQIVAAFGPQRLFDSNSNNDPSPRPFQSWNAKEDYHSLYYGRPFDFTIFPPKCSEASFKRAQSVNKNCLTTPHLLCFTHRLNEVSPLQSKMKRCCVVNSRSTDLQLSEISFIGLIMQLVFFFGKSLVFSDYSYLKPMFFKVVEKLIDE